MRTIPEINTDCGVIYSSIWSQLQPALLTTAIELKLFDLLTEFATADVVAKALRTHPGNTGLLLDGLVSCKLLEKKKGAYRNTPLAHSFLTSDSPTYLGDFFTGASQMMLQLSDALPELVRNGPQMAAHEQQLDSQDVWAGFADQMTRYAFSGNAQQVVEIISRLPEFAGFSRMLDMGGCGGAYAMAFVSAHPDLEAVLFDQPAVIDAAKPLLNRYGYQDRITTLGGNFVSDHIGGEYDFIWVSAALNFSKDHFREVLAKVFQALKPGGVFACMQEGLTHEKTQPQAIVLPMLPRLLAGDDLIWFEQGEIAEALLEVGFKSVRSRTIATTDGTMDIDIARK